MHAFREAFEALGRRIRPRLDSDDAPAARAPRGSFFGEGAAQASTAAERTKLEVLRRVNGRATVVIDVGRGYSKIGLADPLIGKVSDAEGRFPLWVQICSSPTHPPDTSLDQLCSYTLVRLANEEWRDRRQASVLRDGGAARLTDEPRRVCCVLPLYMSLGWTLDTVTACKWGTAEFATMNVARSERLIAAQLAENGHDVRFVSIIDATVRAYCRGDALPERVIVVTSGLNQTGVVAARLLSFEETPTLPRSYVPLAYGTLGFGGSSMTQVVRSLLTDELGIEDDWQYTTWARDVKEQFCYVLPEGSHGQYTPGVRPDVEVPTYRTWRGHGTETHRVAHAPYRASEVLFNGQAGEKLHEVIGKVARVGARNAGAVEQGHTVEPDVDELDEGHTFAADAAPFVGNVFCVGGMCSLPGLSKRTEYELRRIGWTAASVSNTPLVGTAKTAIWHGCMRVTGAMQ